MGPQKTQYPKFCKWLLIDCNQEMAGQVSFRERAVM
jgi:hypothetical protein